ncbi:MAG: MBL fold metallo-hydrolase, partial [bacterium]
LQMIREGFSELDFLLFTHDHSDHLMGLDDVRPITRKKTEPMPCYGPAPTLKEIRKRFHYIFNKTANDTWRPKIQLVEINKKIEIEGLEIIPLPVMHGKTEVYGYRIGNFAYISDVSEIPPATMEKLKNLEILVLEALRFKEHYTHFNLKTALKTARKLEAGTTYLTHCSHDIDYNTVSNKLPEDVFLAYDGLKLELNEEK